jgi:hypothetical protein
VSHVLMRPLPSLFGFNCDLQLEYLSLVYHSNTDAWFSSMILYCSWFWPLNVMSSHCLNNKAHMIEFSSCPFLLNLLGPAPHKGKDYRIRSNFWKFYLIRTRFTLLELVSLVKVFRLFKLEPMFFGVQSVDIVGRCTTSYLLPGPACLWCLV